MPEPGISELQLAILRHLETDPWGDGLLQALFRLFPTANPKDVAQALEALGGWQRNAEGEDGESLK